MRKANFSRELETGKKKRHTEAGGAYKRWDVCNSAELFPQGLNVEE
jgi:hypothetical protein